MAGPTEPELPSPELPHLAPVLRCIDCNYQITVLGTPVPEKCEQCGKKLEKRGMAEVTFK